VRQAVLPRGSDRLDRDLPTVEQAVMVRAEHDDVLDGVLTALTGRNDVANVVAVFVPPTDCAPVDESDPNRRPKTQAVDVDTRIARVIGSARAPSANDSAALVRAVQIRPFGRVVVRERRTAVGAVSRLLQPGWLSRPEKLRIGSLPFRPALARAELPIRSIAQHPLVERGAALNAVTRPHVLSVAQSRKGVNAYVRNVG